MGGIKYKVGWVYSGVSSMMKPLPQANLDVLIEKIRAIGVTTCCMGAGSRSSQLVHALNQVGINMIPFFDERVIGYLALGLIKAKNQPVVALTTSGTAVSNLCPAMTEAANSHLPLIALTADRPKHMQGTSANQTIKQSGVFQDALAEVHWENKNQQSSLDEAIQAMHSFGGPIHINVHLEDPVNEALVQIESKPVVSIKNKPTLHKMSSNLMTLLEHTHHGLLCIGQLEPWVSLASIKAVIDHFDWPVVLDGSNASLKGHPNVVHSVDAFCEMVGGDTFDQVVVLGGRWISKKMGAFLSKNNVVHISEGAKPVVQLKQSFKVSYAELLKPIIKSHAMSISSINKRYQDAFQDVLKQHPSSDLAFINSALNNIKAPFDCFISNSLPARFFDNMQVKLLRNVFMNRGASGIDGNIATIIGLCMEPSEIPLLAIIGDLAALYDLNAFLMLKKCQRPVTIIIINNGGGDIFSLLPSATSTTKFDEQFKCAHDWDLTKMLKGMDCNAVRLSDPSHLTIEFNQNVIECMSSGGADAFQMIQKKYKEFNHDERQY